MELKELKQINNGMIPTEQPTIEEKVASGIGVEGTTGQSTLADRKYINNLPKYSVGKADINPNGISSGHYNFAGRTSAASQLASGPTKIPNNLPTSGGGGANFGKTLGNVASAAAPYAGALLQNATAAVDFVGSIGSAGKFNKSADDLLQEAGGAEGNIGGVSYQTQNEINAQGVAAQTSAENKANTVGLMGKGAALGASLGMVAGPVGSLVGGAVGAIGGLVGGLFGSSKRKREMRRRVAEAQDKALRQNDFSRNGALTSVLQQNYAREYGDTESQSLYGFKDGMLPGFVNGFTPNCKLSNGEHVILHDPIGNPIADIPVGRGRDNKDTLKAFIPNNASVITNKNGATEYLERTGDINGAEYLTAMNIQNKKYKNGKLPGFSGGKWGVPEWANFTGNIIPMIGTGVEYLKSKSEPLGSYTATHSNPNASIASDMMSQRRYNPYQAYRDVWDLYAKNNYASNNSGLSSSQRNLLRTTNYANTLDNIFKINNHAQQMNNQYLGENAEFLDNQGRFNTQLRQADDVKHYDTYTQSHGAADLRNSTLLSQFGNLSQNFTKGVADLDFYRYMKNTFDADRNADNASRAAKYKLNQPAVVKNSDIYNYNLGIPASSKYEDAVANKFKSLFGQQQSNDYSSDLFKKLDTQSSTEREIQMPDLPTFNFGINKYKKGSASWKKAKKGGRK